MMDVENLGALRVVLGADAAQWNKAFDAADKKLGIFSENAAQKLAKVGTVMTVAGGAITAAFALSINKAMAFGDQMDKTSKRTGISTEALSALAYAGEISGTTLESMETSLRFLARAMDDTSKGTGEAKDRFAAMGIAVTDVNGNLRPTVDVMKEVATKIAALTNETEQVTIATDLFGARTGTQLLPILKEGGTGIETLMRRAKDLGLVMSQEASTAAADFKDRVDELKSSLGFAAMELGTTMMPVLKPFVEKITETIGEIIRWVKEHPLLTEQISKFAFVLGGVMAVGGPMLMMAPTILNITKALQGLTIALGAFQVTAGTAGLMFATIGAGIIATIALWKQFKSVIDAGAEVYKGYTDQQIAMSKAIGMLGPKILDATDTFGSLGINVNKLNKELGSNFVATDNASEAIQMMSAILKEQMTPLAQTTEAMQDNAEAMQDNAEATQDNADTAKIFDVANKDLTAAIVDLDDQLRAYAVSLEAISQAEKQGITIAEAYKLASEAIGRIVSDVVKISNDSQESMTQGLLLESEKRQGIIDNYNKLYRLGMLENVDELLDISKLRDKQLRDADQGAASNSLARSAAFWKTQEGFIVQRNQSEISFEEKKSETILGIIDQATARKLALLSNEQLEILKFQAREMDSYNAKKAILDDYFNYMYIKYQESGQNTIGLETWRANELNKLRKQEIEGWVNATTAGLNTISDAYIGLYGLYNDVFNRMDGRRLENYNKQQEALNWELELIGHSEMAEEEKAKRIKEINDELWVLIQKQHAEQLRLEEDSYAKSIANLVKWVDDQAKLVKNLMDIWTGAMTIINKVISLFGAGGGAANIAGAVAGAGTGAGGLAGALSGLGGAAASAGSAIASAASAVAGAIAPWLAAAGVVTAFLGGVALLYKWNNSRYDEDVWEYEWNADKQTWEPPGTLSPEEQRTQQNVATVAANLAWEANRKSWSASTDVINQNNQATIDIMATEKQRKSDLEAEHLQRIEYSEQMQADDKARQQAYQEQKHALDIYNSWLERASMGIQQQLDISTMQAMQTLGIWEQYLGTTIELFGTLNDSLPSGYNTGGTTDYYNANYGRESADFYGNNTTSGGDIIINAGVVIADQYSIDQFANLIAQSMKRAGYI